MSFTHAIRHAADQACSFGPAAALHDLQQRVVNRVLPLQILRGMTISLGDVPTKLFEAGRYGARFASHEEILEAASDEASGMSLDVARDALERGDRCFAVFDRGRIVSSGWYSRRPTLISRGLLLHFDPAWVYMYRGFTLPAYRGQRLHGIGMALALREHARRGARGLITYVRSTNFESLRSVTRMGYRQFGEIYLARVLGRVETWASDGCAAYDFRLESVEVDEPPAARRRVDARA